MAAARWNLGSHGTQQSDRTELITRALEVRSRSADPLCVTRHRQPRNDLHRSNERQIRRVGPDGFLKWKVELGAAIETTAVVAQDGTIYVGANDASLSAISPIGRTLRKVVASGSIRGGLTIDGDGTVYFTQLDWGGGQWWSDDSLHQSYVNGDSAIVPGHLCCFGNCWTSLPAADLQSEARLSPRFTTTMLEDNGDGYGFNGQSVVAFRSDLSERWEAAPDSGAYNRGGMLSVSASGAVMSSAVDVLNHFTSVGAIDWSYPLPTTLPPQVPPTIVDASGTSYLVDAVGDVIAIDANGAVVWSLWTGSVGTSACAMDADGTLYVGLLDGFVYAIGP